MTQEQIWAHTNMANPYEHYLTISTEYWDFVYETERCADVLKVQFPSIAFSGPCANDDANEVLNLMSKWWRDVIFEKYDLMARPREAFNDWWWSKHDIADYEEVTA